MDEQLDTVRYGWGTPPGGRPWRRQLREAKKRDVVVDLTIGPAWPAAVPSITPDSRAASQELAHGIAVLTSERRTTGRFRPP
ncbi:hypothetical protein [Streptomyces sp. KL116D]|uniref:hypothetical protein n=1 Tax=Streptomyces sp. KL116D TaxID=3045152 RepID=UPI003555E9CD